MPNIKRHTVSTIFFGYICLWGLPFLSRFCVEAVTSFDSEGQTKTNEIIQRLLNEIGQLSFPVSKSVDGNQQKNPKDEILYFLTEAGRICMENSTFSAQCEAIKWLASDDELVDSSPIEFIQRFTLAVFYFATTGDEWSYCSRKDTSHCEEESSHLTRFLSPKITVCQWYGIKCQTNPDGTRSHIIWIEFPENNLKKSKIEKSSTPILVNELWLLSGHLELLWLQSNPSLGGTLPSWIGDMNALQSLNLSNIGLEGTIPNSLYQLEHLNALRLYENSLSGTIAPDIGKMSDLSWLWLNNNNLSGRIPVDLGALSKLESVALHNNNFETLEIPNEVCDLRKRHLKHIWTNCAGADPVNVSCKCCTRCFLK